jgi:hypothetical protein
LIDPLLQLLFLRCLEQQRNIQLCLLFLALNCNLLILSYLAAHTINLMVAERIRSQEQPCKHPTHDFGLQRRRVKAKQNRAGIASPGVFVALSTTYQAPGFNKLSSG